jgi:hypothetical protein
MPASPSLVLQPAGNSCVERCICTLKEQLLCVRVFQNIEELRCALAEFRERYKPTLDRPALGLPHARPSSPASSLHSEPPDEYTQLTVQKIQR